MDHNGLQCVTLGSLFDGIGGFPLCAEISGIVPLWAAEIDPACVAVTKNRFPDMVHYGDVSKIDGAKIPPVDIITFGSPCQDLSVAGKRQGIKHKERGDGETTRSGLFVEAVRIVYEMRRATNGLYPTFIVWENVPGAFSSHNGRDFRAVLEEITKTDIPMPTSGKWANAGMVRGGAICAAWRVLDGQYWGIAQRRRRIFLVGSFGSDAAEKILFKPDSVRRYLAPCGKERENASADIGTSATKRDFVFDCRGNGNGTTAPTITGDHNSRVSDFSAVVISTGQKENILRSGAFRAEAGAKARGIGYSEKVSPTIISTPNKQPCVVYALQGSMIGRKEKNGPQGDGINENVCFTLNTSDRHCVAYQNSSFGGYSSGIGTLRGTTSKRPEENVIVDTQEWNVRRLTPLECERLQGYPDGWTILPKIEDMTEEEYEFFKSVVLLDKKIKGKKAKYEPTKKQIVRWYNKLDVDGTRYRQLGNSLAIPCALRVIGGIAEYIAKERKV